MIRSLPSRALPLALLPALGCVPDGVKDTAPLDSRQHIDDTVTGGADDSDPPDDSAGNTGTEQRITGSWRSEGEDIAPLLLAAGVAKVDATFNGDGSYTTVVTDTQGRVFNLAGSYTVSTATDPGTISLSQTVPTSLEAEGIWQVSGSRLTYEVVQTSPDQGFTPPTPQAGFGSTRGANVEAGSNIQIYVAR